MPFGLTNGPEGFTQLMNLVLNSLTRTHCLVYLDDIITWAITFNPFSPGNFANKRVLKLVEQFSSHCLAIKS